MKKTLSILMTVLVICSCFVMLAVSASANKPLDGVLGYSDAIDENGQLIQGCGGSYFYCSKANKFFPAQENRCPYCGETKQHTKDAHGFPIDYFENGSYVYVYYFLKCCNCNMSCATAVDVAEIMDKKSDCWNHDRYLCCRYCTEDMTECVDDCVHKYVAWEYDEAPVEYKADENVVFNEEKANEYKEEVLGIKVRPQEDPQGLTFWQSLLEKIKGFFGAIASFFVSIGSIFK